MPKLTVWHRRLFGVAFGRSYPEGVNTITTTTEGDIQVEFTFVGHNVIVTDERIYVDGVIAADLA